MPGARLLLVLLMAVAVPLTSTHTTNLDGDFAFDCFDDSQLHSTLKPVSSIDCPVRRLWGVPDMPAYIGHMFHLRIPKEAFAGKAVGYKASGVEGPLPSWLWVDGHHGVIRGVPGPEERGEHRVLVTALSKNKDHNDCPPATDIFTIEVKDKKDSPMVSHGDHQCHMGEDETRLVIIINKSFHQITPKQRLNAIMKLAHFMGLDYNAFIIQPHEVFENKDAENDLVLMSGAHGAKKQQIKGSSEIILTVGCSGVLWTKHSILVHQIKQQVAEGTISDVVHLPVKSWKVIRSKQSPYPRRRRQVREGSAYDELEDADDEDYNSGYDEYDYEGGDGTTEKVGIVPAGSNKTDDELGVDEEIVEKKVEATNNAPVIIPVTEPTTEEIKKQTDEVTIEPIVPEIHTTPETHHEPSPEEPETIPTEPSTPQSEVSKSTYGSFVPYTNKETMPVDTTSERSSTIIGRTTETVEFNIPTLPTNSPPEKQHRTKKVAVTSGKYFSFFIPEDLFIDAEDGTNLQLSMYDIEHIPLKPSSWVQFDPRTREVYGLPLEEHVSKWEYMIQATDSKGASVTDTLDITVQQHKGRRAVNHEFSMKLRIEKKYPAVVDWQIRALKGLVDLFRDTDMDQITVRGVDLEADPVEFMWTNDTLPKHFCPRSDIIRLMDILQSTPDGDPSSALTSAMSPELRVKSVSWRGTGACTSPPTLHPPSHPDNFGPMPRNQIDHINATAGKLLVFKVPEDTFYDPEDGSARNLKMSLIRGDRSNLPNFYWLQFDSKNQEFFGVPMDKDVGRKEYQLIAEDSSGLTANDGLILEVHPAPHIRATVEFQMTLDPPNQHFLKSPLIMRSFVESLKELFGDSDTSSILIKSVTTNPVVVSWYNTSLPVDRCPEGEINKLRKFLVGDDAVLTQRADEIMGHEFPVISVSMEPLGACSPETTFIKIPEVPTVKRPNEDASKTVESDDYLITFIVPIIVIVLMILIAMLIACVLYKKRRMGKMSMGDDEERQAFRSKGIPVIFQDELDEKPDPSNKSPVIMKEEKPPLLPPPEYGGDSGSPTPSHAPYHPPPPFTASRETARNTRPKPTPTYRKPPPYVPP